MWMQRLLASLILALTFVAGPASAAEVLVYYANEPRPNEAEERNLRTLMGWLLDSGVALNRRIAELLAEDRKLFPETVERDLLQLHTRLRDDPSWRGLGVAVFTNKLAGEGKALVHRPGGDGLEPVAFPMAAQEDMILAAQPLSSAETLRRALRLVADTFAPADYQAAVVVKTHATRTLAVAPLAGTSAEATSREAFLASLPRDDSGTLELAQVGIGRDEFAAAFRSSGLRLSLVFLDAVYEAPSFDGLIRTSSSPARKYATIPYAALAPGPEAGGLAGALERSIAAQLRVEKEGEAAGATSLIRYLLLAPLLAGGVVFVWLARRSSRGDRVEQPAPRQGPFRNN